MKSVNHLDIKRQKTKKLIVSETCTYSKHQSRYGSSYPFYIESGGGPYVYDQDGHMYIDYISALGANLLGYADPYVNAAVKYRVDKGILFSAPSYLETELAEKLNELFPYMEKIRFLKSGSEAVSAGIKIARAYTGRDKVISIGYHGWHDWSSASSLKSGGSPKCLADLCINSEYNNLAHLKSIFSEEKIACVVMEPFMFDEPEDDYLRKVINLAHKNKALVLFDEVVTGMRWKDYSVSNFYEIQPDLFTMGKGLANGFPLSVIGGEKELMSELDHDCFVSSTFGGELASISAALAVIDVCKNDNVPDRIYESGEDIKYSFNEIADSFKIEARATGNPARIRFDFPSDNHRILFWQECAKAGVLFGYANHVTFSHVPSVISKTVDVISLSLRIVRDNWEHPESKIEGFVPKPVEVVRR